MDMSNSKGKIVGIVGSGRHSSNSKRLLTIALNAAESVGADTTMINVLSLNFSGCNGCNECLSTGACSIVDDLTEVYEILDLADGVIVATPVYFYGVPGQLKLLVDRFQALWAKRYALRSEPEKIRPGGLISVAGSEGKRAFDGVLLTVKYFFDVQGIKLGEPLLFRGWDGEPEDLPEKILVDAAEYGRKISQMAMRNV